MSQAIKTTRGRGAGFSWSQDGSCHGVIVESSSGKCKVVAHWSSGAGAKGGGIAEALEHGRRKLGIGDTDYCVAGPVGGGWGMADIQMPPLKAEAMQSALAFELKKLTPIPAERLTWGYRVLGEGKEGKTRMRIFYARTDFWRKWLEAANGLGKIDMLSPAPVLLDPLFEDIPVTFASDGLFTYVPGTDGREAMPAQKADSLKEMLPSEGLDIGALAELEEGVRREYAEAVCMAIYAMGRELSKDAGTMPQVPSHMRPSRFIAARIMSACLAIVILFFLGAGLVKALQQRAARIRLIRKDISAVEAQMKSLRAGVMANGDQAAKNFEAEMGKYNFGTPELSDVLMEITDMVKPPAWLAGAFDWNADYASNVVSISFTIREPVGDKANIDLVTRLNRSPILGDASENKNVMNRAGFMERRITLKARYDTPDEKALLERELEEMRKKEAESKSEDESDDESDESDESESGEQEEENVED